MDSAAQLSRPQGRPRDPEVDARILTEARRLYAERGWAGFNFDVVARNAKVSKDALYRRYRDKGELLLAAMSDQDDVHARERAVGHTATLRDYLVAVAQDYFAIYTSEAGFDFLRIQIEAPHNGDLLAAFHGQVSLPEVRRVRGIVRRAIQLGVLRDVAGPTALLNALIGGVMMQVLATPPEFRARMIARSDEDIQKLVELLLRGAGYAESTDVRVADLLDVVEDSDG